MRTGSIYLLALLAASAPAGAQGIAVPLRCPGECPATLPIDSVLVSANVQQGEAITYARNVFRNHTAGTVDAAFFFPLPPDAALHDVHVTLGGELTQYDEWSRAEESRWILQGVARDRPDVPLGEYAAAGVVHVPVRDIPPGGTVHLRIAYGQTLPMQGGSVVYRYPLATGAAAAPTGHADIVMTVKTAAGFRDIRSTSHRVDIQLGQEPGPCQPRERCGMRGYPSERVREIRLLHGDRSRDFELVYAPRDPEPAGPPGVASVP